MILYKPISWEQFGIIAGGTSLVYYAAVGWYGYRHRITGLFKKRRSLQQDEAEPPGLVGRSRPDQGISHVEAGELVFSEADNGQMTPEVRVEKQKPVSKVPQLMKQISRDQQASLLGSVADTMEEIKALLDSSREAGENRENLLQTLQLLAPKLQELSGTTYPDALNLFLLDEIRRRFPFELSAADLRPLWTSTQSVHLKK